MCFFAVFFLYYLYASFFCFCLEIYWKMFTFVKSSSENFLLRFAIRRTWASIRYLDGGEFKAIFVIGQTDSKAQEIVEKEHQKYGDILQIEIPDNYR